jgi:hypothetical protein
MYKIIWDELKDRLYENGISRNVLYLKDNDGNYPKGVAWNGITAINENFSGGDIEPLYVDNVKYQYLISTEEFGLTIEAFTYPDEFLSCDGSLEAFSGISMIQQPRNLFGLCYRTLIGNYVEAENHGYKLHLIYGCLASPTEKPYQTINESIDPITFNWKIATTPVDNSVGLPTSALIIDSTKVNPSQLETLENILYGTLTPNLVEGRLPLPDEIFSMFTSWFTVGISLISFGRIKTF